MAAASNLTVTEELLASVTEPFTKVVCLLDDNKNAITDKIMHVVRQRLGNRHWVDLNRFVQGCRAKPEGIYDMFGEYFEKNQIDVRNELAAWINDRKVEIEDNIRIVLGHKNLSFEAWLTRITDLKYPADELVIYCLAKKYYKHVVIYTATYSWSTLARHFTYTKEEIRDKCQIQLIHRGPCKYAELRLIGLPRSQSNPAANIVTDTPKDEMKNEDSDTLSGTKKTKKTNDDNTNENHHHSTKSNDPKVKYKILQCVISANNIIPSERKHNTRDSNRSKNRKSTKPVRTTRRSINYAKLNDGLDPFTPPSPKRQRRNSYRPQKDGPSEQRQLAVGTKNNVVKSMDLEEIMDTTLDDDNLCTESLDSQNEKQDSLIEEAMDGVTLGVDSDRSEKSLDNNPIQLETSEIESKQSTITTMDRVTDPNGEITPPLNVEIARATSNSEPFETEVTSATMDGVSKINDDTTLPSNAEVARVDGVTLDKTDMSPFLITTKEHPNRNDNSGDTTKLDGVTTQSEQTITASTSSNTKKSTTLEEMVANIEFPEKRALLDGVTDLTTQSTTSETQLPDLITNKDHADKSNKSPTERLLETYMSHIANESEDIEGSIPMRDCPTTEDEDDAIDGLLALSNSSPRTVSKPKSQVTSNKSQRKTTDNIQKAITRKKKAGNYTKIKTNRLKKPKKKSSKKSKNTKENRVEAEKLGEQLQDMNLNERSSRTQNKEIATNGSGTTRKNKRPRRDDSSDSPGSPPGVFTVTHHTLRRKETKEKNYRCGQCTLKAKSMDELKRHYAKKHKKVMCSICNRTFDSDIILARHNYTHYDKRYYCKKCKEGFYFKSELKKHKVSHAKTPSFQCMVAGCGKWFKRVAEVNVHMEIHKKRRWSCDLCKDFTTTCEKYLKDHFRTDHNPNGLPYGCINCGKGFKYRMQLKRHNNNSTPCSK